MKDIEKLIDNGIMAIIPVYLDIKGNSTKVVTLKEGYIYIYKTIQTVIKLIARYFTVDLQSVRKYYGGMIGAKNIVPIPFNKQNIYVPIKVRKPISKNDGSMAYFNLKSIERIEDQGCNTFIILNGGVKVKTLQKKNSVEKQIIRGNLVEKMYNGKIGISVCEDSIDFYEESSKLATKADIAVIRNELLDIKSKL